MDEVVSNVTLVGLLLLSIMTFCIGNGGARSLQLPEVGQIPLPEFHVTLSGMFTTPPDDDDDPLVEPPEPLPERVMRRRAVWQK